MIFVLDHAAGEGRVDQLDERLRSATSAPGKRPDRGRSRPCSPRRPRPSGW